MWKNLEVHVIYEIVYTLCMSRMGFLAFQKYFSSDDPHIHEPFFIAQFILAPINTIVKKTLVPWMMEEYPMNTEVKDDLLYCACVIKAKVYFKYTLLEQVMEVVKMYGQYPQYDFSSDPLLNQILNGEYGVKDGTGSKKKVTKIDSFLTLWLITLSEKFQEWYDDFHGKRSEKKDNETSLMNMSHEPTFPEFVGENTYTSLSPNPDKKNYISSSFMGSIEVF